jgi:hypothetical protein
MPRVRCRRNSFLLEAASFCGARATVTHTSRSGRSVRGLVTAAPLNPLSSNWDMARGCDWLGGAADRRFCGCFRTAPNDRKEPLGNIFEKIASRTHYYGCSQRPLLLLIQLLFGLLFVVLFTFELLIALLFIVLKIV